MKTTLDLFREWVEVMGDRWGKLNVDGKTVIQDFGPVRVVMIGRSINVEPMVEVDRFYLPFYEDVRRFVKTRLEEARHEAAKKALRVFEAELRQDLAEAEFMGDREETRL